MNQLRDVLPPRVRLYLYIIYAAVGLLLGSVQIGYGAAELGTPVWLVVALAVYAYVGMMTGLTAAANVPNDDGSYPVLVDTAPSVVVVEEPKGVPGDTPAPGDTGAPRTLL